MALFQYVALDQRGKEVHGQVEGADLRAAAAALRGQSLFIVRLEGAGGGSAVSTAADMLHADLGSLLGTSWRWLLPVTARDQTFFFQQLALMLRTGLTLSQSLEVARDQALKPRLAAAIDRVADTIQQGQSLSRAMATQPGMFPTLAIKLIETGEASGELDRILDQVALHLDRKAELRRKLFTAMMYPAIVVLLSLAVATFLVVAIIPKFAAFFARRQVALPWATQLLMEISEFVVQYGPWIAGGLAAGALALTIGWMVPASRRMLDRILLSVPIVGGLLTVAAMAQFSQTLGMLLSSGVTLLESLRITSTVIGNRALEAALRDAAEQILRGNDLTRSLRNRLIPRLVTQVVAVGERTGSLAHVLDELGTFYDRQLQARIQRMSAMIEPAMILIVGGMVGFVYFAFFQAVFQLSTGAR